MENLEKLKIPERITIESLIDTGRNVPNDYRRLISKTENQGNLPTGFSDQWSYFLWEMEKDGKENELSKFLEVHLRGQLLIDLGAGTGRTVGDICRIFGVKDYVSVDRHYMDFPNKLESSDISYREEESEGLHEILVNSDMLDFISRMPDNRGNFILNGIDSWVIRENDYFEALAKELIRTTKKDGIIFGIESDITYPLNALIKKFKQDSPIEVPDVKLVSGNSFLYRKK